MMNRNVRRQAQQMQEMEQRLQKIQEVQEEIASATSEASVGGGAVRAVVVGGSRVESIEIDPEVVDPEDVEMLQDLVTAAVNEAMDSAQQDAAKKMQAITGGLNLPGLGF